MVFEAKLTIKDSVTGGVREYVFDQIITITNLNNYIDIERSFKEFNNKHTTLTMLTGMQEL